MKKLRAKVLHFSGILILLTCFNVSGVFAKQDQFGKNQLRTLATFKKIDHYPLFEMTVYHDYDFDGFLKKGVTITARSLPDIRGNEKKFACTCFASLNKDGDKVFGRNFDWYDHPALILFTNPSDGYKSVSIVDISYLDFVDDNAEPTRKEKKNLLEAPFIPFDGMNEHGLAVGMMAVRNAKDRYDPEKVTIRTLHLIRLMLDYAKDVEGALSLLQKYNIRFGEPPLHFLIADASGKSAVIEFINGKRYILRNKEPWQVSTNFIISNVIQERRKSVCWRYRKANDMLEKANGKLKQENVMNVLKNVSQPSTVWSAVYNLTTGNILVTMGRKYEKIYKFKLKNE